MKLGRLLLLLIFLISCNLITVPNSQVSISNNKANQLKTSPSIIIKGKIIFPDKFKTQALTSGEIIANSTVNLIDSSNFKIVSTTISDNNGEFEFTLSNLPQGYYYTDVNKREKLIGSENLFMRSLLRFENDTLDSITGNKIIISPMTTAVALSITLDKTAGFEKALNKVEQNGAALKGEQISDVTPDSMILNVLAQINNSFTNQTDPIKEKYIFITMINKQGFNRSEEVEITGLGFDANTNIKLGAENLEILESTPNRIRAKIGISSNTANLKAYDTVKIKDSNEKNIQIATKVKIIEGNYQLCTVGQKVLRQMKLQALDVNDTPVPDIKVHFNITKGNGKVYELIDSNLIEIIDSVTTGTDGFSIIKYEADQTGFNDIEINIEGGSEDPQKFTHIGIEGSVQNPGQHLFAMTEGISGEARTKYTGTVKVLVMDNGQPVQNASIMFHYVGDPPIFAEMPESNQTSPYYYLSKNTNSEGIAEISNFHLPFNPGNMAIGLYYLGQKEIEIPLVVTSPTRSLQTLEIVEGDNQSGEAGRDLAQRLMVRALDQNSNPIANVPVVFSITQGQGQMIYVASGTGTGKTVNPITIKTGTAGKAYINFKAPITLQTVKITASADGKTAVFTEDITKSSTNILSQISPLSAPSINTGQVYSYFQVKLTDPDGNGVNNKTVNFSVSSGCTQASYSSSVTTDETGIAQTTFSVEQLNGCYGTVMKAISPDAGTGVDSVYFPSIYTCARPAQKITYVSGDGQPGQVGRYLTNKLFAKKRDIYDNPTIWDYTSVKFATVDDTGNPVTGKALINETPDTFTVTGSSTDMGVSVIPLVLGQITIRATLQGGAYPFYDFTIPVTE